MTTRTIRTWLAPATALVAMTALAGCTGVQSALVGAGEQGATIRQVWNLMLAVCGTMYVVVLIALGIALVRRRRELAREGTTRDRSLSIALGAWSLLVVGLLTVLVAASYTADRRIRSGHADLAVRVTAKQWWWQVDYLDQDSSRRFTTANELHLPRDRTVQVELVSGDVIHSFWVPALTGKHDLVPGRTNALMITPRAGGYYRGQCAEFCGLQHAKMAMDVQVDDLGAYQAWADHQRTPATPPTTPSAQRGLAVFERGACAMCHRIAGTTAGGVTGPDLTHLASRRSIAAGTLPMNRGNLAAWIVDPQHPKPGANMPAVPLSPQDVSDLVDYLTELK
ncbi:cytochrome c oxidase subunit II [Cognatilysobacter terrigena]|uniref:cytochrome c oxidase subunit II n=1 Tax=Cognatilysobacter terrigena TaxID=2488749 RepID=UPI00105ED0C5|nr:cytochrome c oxidase subunit II [Lysobacter terrigena]